MASLIAFIFLAIVLVLTVAYIAGSFAGLEGVL